MSLRIALNGASGRMGRALLRVFAEDKDIELVGAVDSPGSEWLGRPVSLLVSEAHEGMRGCVITHGYADALRRADVMIDFSSPKAMRAAAEACLAVKKPMVVGTTGFGDEEDAALRALGRVAPVVVAPNMSVGVAVMLHLAEKAAVLLGTGWDAEIIEAHHRHKLDAPSGTAKKIAQVVAKAKKLDAQRAIVTDRSGDTEPRKASDIGVVAVRGGDIVGEHTLMFAANGERLELIHRATSREIFAHGALRAARWVIHRPAGVFGMPDVLGLEGK